MEPIANYFTMLKNFDPLIIIHYYHFYICQINIKPTSDIKNKIKMPHAIKKKKGMRS